MTLLNGRSLRLSETRSRIFFIYTFHPNREFRHETLHRLRVFLRMMRTLYGTTTLLRAACSSQKKPEEFPFIVGIEMLSESRAVLCVREADSSAAASPAWRYAKEFPLHFSTFSTIYQPLRTITLSCLFLFIYLTRRITTIPLYRLCELSLALRPIYVKKRENCFCLKIIKLKKNNKNNAIW